MDTSLNGHTGPPRITTARVKTPPRTKQSLPETLSQARRWDTVKNEVRAYGLCDACAAQYAWGVQIGFTHSKPPCEPCTYVVASYDGRERPNNWRTIHHTRSWDRDDST